MATNVEPVTVAATPLTVTVTESVESAGVATPVTCTELFEVLVPSVGDEMLTTGGVALARTCTRVGGAVFPATSLATKVSKFAPGLSATLPVMALPTTVSACPFTVTLAATASVTVPTTAVVSAATFEPSAGVVTTRLGGTAFCVTCTVAEPEFPAWSVATAVSVFAPATSGTAPTQPPSPSGSSAVPPTITPLTGPLSFTSTTAFTVVWFVISPFGGAAHATCGGVVSTPKVTLWVVTLPARSFAITVKVCSPLTLTTAGCCCPTPSSVALTSPRFTSVAVYQTVTGALLQVPSVTPVMLTAGAIRSRVKTSPASD